MPTPVSRTENASTASACSRCGWSAVQPEVTRLMVSDTWPWLVNLNAFDSRFLSTCCRRVVSVITAVGRLSASSTEKPRCLASAMWRKVRST